MPELGRMEEEDPAEVRVDGKMYFAQPPVTRELAGSKGVMVLVQLIWLSALAILCVTVAFVVIAGPEHDLSKFIAGRLDVNLSVLFDCFRDSHPADCLRGKYTDSIGTSTIPPVSTTTIAPIKKPIGRTTTIRTTSSTTTTSTSTASTTTASTTTTTITAVIVNETNTIPTN